MTETWKMVSYETYAGDAAQNYERYFVPVIGEPVARDLIAAADLRAGERVLDVACGTGIVTRLAAEHVGPGGALAGLDLNPGMVAVARSTAPAEPSSEWHEASADAMPLPDGAFDVVLCSMGLQFMADKAAALSEMRRVLAPGGRVLVTAPGPTPTLFQIFEDALARHLGGQAAGFVDAVFSLHDPRELSDLMTAAGFGDVTTETHTKRLPTAPPADFLWQYVHSTPLAGPLAEVGADTRAAIQDEVVGQWEPFVDDGVIIVEVDVLTGTAHRG